MPDAPQTPTDDRPENGSAGAPGRREGSRLLLAVALAAAVGAAFVAGGFAADALSDLLQVVSPRARLAVRLLAVVAAIPAAFYVVERAFICRTSRP